MRSQRISCGLFLVLNKIKFPNETLTIWYRQMVLKDSNHPSQRLPLGSYQVVQVFLHQKIRGSILETYSRSFSLGISTGQN